MTRLNLLLLLALVLSAAYLVRTSYEGRRLFVALERERALAQDLAADTERLQLDRRAQATHLRVERVARERLSMRSATAAVTQYVSEAAPATGAKP
jgi:cell division protein FtsL